MSQTTKPLPFRSAETPIRLDAAAWNRCADAVLATRSTLAVPPEPTWRWYDLADRPTRVRPLFAVLEMLRGALSEARATGTLPQTRAQVAACLDVFAAEVLRGFDAPSEAVLAGAVTVAKELGEAIHASMAFAADPMPSNRIRAAVELAEAEQAGRVFVRAIHESAAQRTRSA